MTRVAPALAALAVLLASAAVSAQPVLAPGASVPRRVVVFPAQGDPGKKLKDAPARLTAAIAAAATASGAKGEVSSVRFADAAKKAKCTVPDSPGCGQLVAGSIAADAVVVISVAAADTGLFVDVDVVPRDGAGPPHTTWLVEGGDAAAIEKDVAAKAPALFAAPVPEPTPEPQPEPSPGPSASPPVVDDAPPAPPEEPEQPSRLARVKLYTWITLGAGVALTGAGTFFMVSASGKQDDIDGADPRTLRDFRQLARLEDQAETRALWGNLLVGAGVAAIGAGAVLAVLQMRAAPPTVEEGQVAVSPLLLDGGAGVALTVGGP